MGGAGWRCGSFDGYYKTAIIIGIYIIYTFCIGGCYMGWCVTSKRAVGDARPYGFY